MSQAVRAYNLDLSIACIGPILQAKDLKGVVDIAKFQSISFLPSQPISISNKCNTYNNEAMAKN